MSIVERAEALHTFAAIWGDGMLLGDLGERLTCAEAEALAGAFRALDKPDAAETLIAAHSRGDDDPEDDHYEGESDATAR